MADEHVAIGQLARADALEKVVDVVERHIVRLGLDDYGLLIFASRMELVMPAVDVEPSLGAAHLDRGSSDARSQRGLKRGREFGGIFQKHVDGVGRRAAIFVVIDAAGGDRRFGNLLTHEHVDHINPVRKQVGHLPTAEIQVSAKIPVLLRVVIPPLDRAKITRPIEVGRLLLE